MGRQDQVHDAKHKKRVVDAVDYARTQVLRAQRAVPAPIPTVPTDIIPGYDILEEIHRGGQGIVYKARRHSTQQLVAIKVLRWAQVARPTEHFRFDRELRVLAALRHTNIVSLHDGGVSGDYRYFVMDYVEGRSLREYVDERQSTITERLRLFLRICRAVEAAHQRGIIHRDLKPANVIVDNSGEPRVIDFGLAKVISAGDYDPTSNTMTIEGHFLGSLPWAAPEQAEGNAVAVDTRTDVYGLGALLYVLLTGRPPFEWQGSSQRVLEAICKSDPPPPGSIVSGLDGDLDTIALKCLSKEPDRRYATVSALARDIERHLAGEPITARQDSAWYVVRRSLRRHRVAAIALSIVGIATVFYAVTMTVMLRRTEEAEYASRRQFAIASDALDFLIEEVDDRLDDVGRTKDLRRSILHGSQRYLTRLASVRGDTPEITRGRARAYTRLGDISLSLGDTRDAEHHFNSALAEQERLRGLASATIDDEIERSLAIVRIGDTYKERGQVNTALTYYERAWKLDRQLLVRRPQNLRVLDNVVWSHERLGFLARENGNRVEACKHFKSQFSLAERLLAIQPTPANRWAMACALGQLGQLADSSGDDAQCNELNTKRLALLETLTVELPSERRYQHALASALAVQSGLALRSGNEDAAIAYAESSLKLAARLLDLNPDEPRNHIGYLTSLTLLAEILTVQSTPDLERAWTIYAQASTYAQELVNKAPGSPDYWAKWFDILRAQARLSMRRKDRTNAEKLYRKVFNIADEIQGRELETASFWLTSSYVLRQAVPEDIRDTSAAVMAARNHLTILGYESPRALIALADALADNGQIKDARATARHAQSQVPPTSTTLQNTIDQLLKNLPES